MTWARLSQGFRNSPTIFDEALHEDLSRFQIEHPGITLLQYVDDLLIEAASEPEYTRATGSWLQILWDLGYRTSTRKVQLCRTEVTYLQYVLREGQHWLSAARKETVLNISCPKTPQQVREFLGAAGYCRLWIPGFAELAGPLYANTKETKSFSWAEEHQ